MLGREKDLIDKNILELEMTKGQLRAEIRRLRLEKKPENVVKMAALKQAVNQINLYKGPKMIAAYTAALNELDDQVTASNDKIQIKEMIIQRLNHLSMNLLRFAGDLTPEQRFTYADNIVGLASRLKEENALNFFIIDELSKNKINLEEFADIMANKHLIQSALPKVKSEIEKSIQKINAEISSINTDNYVTTKRKEQIIMWSMDRIRKVIEDAKKLAVALPVVSSVGYFSRSIPQRIRDAKDLENKGSPLKRMPARSTLA
jgi:hypothetical protein